MAAGDLITQDRQFEIWRSDTDRLLIGPGTVYRSHETRGFATPAARTSDTPKQQDHGDVAGVDRWESRMVEGDWEATANAGASLLSALGALGKAFRLMRAGETDATLVYKPAGAPKRMLTGRPRGAEWPDDWRSAHGGSLPVGWRFYAPDPRWRSLTEISKTVSIEAGQTTVSTTIYNNGDAEVDPILEIQGPWTNPRIANQQDGNRQLKIDIALTAGETLIVDFAKRSVTLAGADRAGTVRTDNQWFELVPGANLITASRSGTTGVANLKTRWRDAWVTVGTPSLDFSSVGAASLIADYDVSKARVYSPRYLRFPGVVGNSVTAPNDDSARTGNRLTKNQASIETSTNGWIGSTNAGSLARSTAQAADGQASLAVTATAVAPLTIVRTRAGKDGFRVAPNTQYTALASLRSATAGRSFYMDILWHDAAGALIIGSPFGADAVSTTTGWTQASVTATSPANAAYATVRVNIKDVLAAEVHYIDKADFHAGASTVWTAGREEDLQIVVDVAPDAWVPLAIQALVAKMSPAITWMVRLETTGKIAFYNYPTQSSSGGEPFFGVASSVATGLAPGVRKKVKVTLDIDDGAGNKVIKFFLSDDGIAWAQLGTSQVLAGTTWVAENVSLLETGQRNNVEAFAGKIFSAEVREGIDGVVRASPSFDRAATSSFTDAQANTWTVNGLLATWGGPDEFTYGRLASLPNQVAGQAAATQTDVTRQPWLSDRDFWLALPGASGAYASTENDDANRTGNRLTKNQASLETSTNGWLATGGNSSISRSTAQASDGAASLLLTATAAGAISARTRSAKSGNRVLPSTQYTLVAEFRAGQVVALETAFVEIAWYDATGTFISQPAGTAAAITNAGWTQRSVTSVSPANAAYATVLVTVASGVLNNLYYVDKISLHAGSSTVWTAGREEDLDVRARVALDTFTPFDTLVGKWNDSTGNAAYLLALVTTSAQIKLHWSPDGTTNLNVTSNALNLAAGSIKWIRATLDIDDGAGNRVIKFFISDDGATWTQHGSTVTQAGATSIYESSVPITVGAYNNGTGGPMRGKVYYAEVRDQIDSTGTTTLRANPNFETADASGFADDAGNGWAVNGTASIAQSAVRTAELRFGMDEFLNLPNLMAGAAAGTALAVVRTDADPAPPPGQGLWELGTDDANFFPFTDGVIYDGFGTTVRKTTVNPSPSLASQFRVYTAISAAADWRNYLDGDPLFSTTTNTVGWRSNPTVSRSNVGAGLKGRIKRLLLYRSKLSDADRQAAEAELLRAV